MGRTFTERTGVSPARGDLIVDMLATVPAIAFTYLFSGPTWAGPVSALFSIVVGLPFVLLRRTPAVVTGYLALLLVVCDVAGWFGGNAVQLLLTLSLVAVAWRCRPQVVVLVAVLAGLANLGKLAASAAVPHPAVWLVPIAFTVVPVAIGRLAARREPVGRPIEAIDMVLGVSGATVAVVQTWPAWSAGSVSAGILPLAGLFLAAGRRHPWAVLLLQCATVLLLAFVVDPAAHGAPLPVLVCVAVGLLAGQAGPRTTVLGALIAWPVVAAVLYRASPDVPPAVAIVLSTLPVGVAVAVGCFQHVRLVAAQRRTEAAAARARAGEREQIAREVHDVVAHHIAAIAFMAGAVSAAAGPVSRDPAGRALDDIRWTARRALDDLRGVLDVLRDPVAAPSDDLVDALGEVVHRVTAAGVPVDPDIDPGIADAPLVVRAATLRIVQECLTNVLKHAGPGATARVSVRAGVDRLEVSVTDTGSGHRRRAATAGNGILGMRERASALGGHLTAGPGMAGGWQVVASLPTRRSVGCA